MPAERVSMRRVREILRSKFECGRYDRAIAVAVSVARSTVQLCLARSRVTANRYADTGRQAGGRAMETAFLYGCRLNFRRPHYDASRRAAVVLSRGSLKQRTSTLARKSNFSLTSFATLG
jgi:hypothetical protein